jgi:hypothetical protein
VSSVDVLCPTFVAKEKRTPRFLQYVLKYIRECSLVFRRTKKEAQPKIKYNVQYVLYLLDINPHIISYTVFILFEK